MDISAKEWKQGIFRRILASYNAKNANTLAGIMKLKFGIKRSAVYAWRDGRSKPVDDLLKRISADTGEDYGWLLTGGTGRQGEGFDQEKFEESKFGVAFYKYNKVKEPDREELDYLLDLLNREIDRKLKEGSL